jgi:hypothetical protein
MQNRLSGLFSSNGSQKRNISAPFQQNYSNNDNFILPTIQQQSNSVDFRSFSFTPLTPFDRLRFEDVSQFYSSHFQLKNIFIFTS